VEIDCHTIREKIQQGLLKLLLVRTNQQLADILTKALPPGLFSKLNSKLGSHNIYCPLEGESQNTTEPVQQPQILLPRN